MRKMFNRAVQQLRGEDWSLDRFLAPNSRTRRFNPSQLSRYIITYNNNNNSIVSPQQTGRRAAMTCKV